MFYDRGPDQLSEEIVQNEQPWAPTVNELTSSCGQNAESDADLRSIPYGVGNTIFIREVPNRIYFGSTNAVVGIIESRPGCRYHSLPIAVHTIVLYCTNSN